MMTLAEMAHRLGGEVSGGQILCPGPGHSPKDRSLSVKPSDDGLRVIVHSFSGDPVSVCLEHVWERLGLPPSKAKKKTNGAEHKKLVATFDYRNADGTLAFQVLRFEPKKFQQRRPDGNGGWYWKGGPPLLYHLPELIEAIALDHVIFMPEGESKVDLLRSWNIAATCNAGGSKNWKSEHSEYLRGADVVLLPDNDDAGWAHINKVGEALTGIAARVRVLILPGLPPKGDIVNWAASGGTREKLDQLLDQAQDWKPPQASSDDQNKARATASEDELLEALAAMRPGIQLDRARKAAAKKLGVSREAIDDEIEARREASAEAKVAPLYGHWITEPWPEVADGDALLRDIIKRAKSHVVTSDENILTAALWWMMSWVHDEVAVHSPILCITSASHESGKSTFLKLGAFLMPRCIPTVEISEAALYRSIARWHPTFAIDEFDKVLKSDSKASLQSVINAGHMRIDCVIRCNEQQSYAPEPFEVFAAKAIAMNGRAMPAATLSRCIFLEVRKRKDSEPRVKFKAQDDAELAELRARLMRWSLDNAEALRNATPTMPFQNRLEDNWWLLIAIADLCGLDWGDKARAAALAIEGASDTTSIAVRLLADIKRIFDEYGYEAILSATLVERLNADSEAPWATWSKGKGLTSNSLATLLNGGGGRSRGGFGIWSQDVHLPGDIHGKGYKKHQFEDSWERWIPSSSKGVE